MSQPEHPRLRNLDRVTLERDGEQLVVLYDPLELSEPVALDADFEPVLDLLVGERSLAQIRPTLMMRSGAPTCTVAELEEFVADLSDAGMLDDDAFVAQWTATHRAFLAAPARQARVAGAWFPAKAEAFSAACEAAFGDPAQRVERGGKLRGLWTPAEPLSRSAEVFDESFHGLPRADELDLIVVLGADRQRGLLPFALTDKPFETPLGPVPAAKKLIRELESELDWARREEMRHRLGGAIELPCAMLRWAYGAKCPPVLAVSCAATSLERGNVESEAFFEALELALVRRRVLVWASGAISHCGPAYGGPAEELGEQREGDIACIDAALRGAPDTLLRRCMPQARARATGGATAYAMLRLLDADLDTELSSYELTPAPGNDEGAAGMVGMRFCAT